MSLTFSEQIMLLLLTAVLIPSVKLTLDYIKEWRGKKRDAALARQEKIIEDQIKLSEELARLVWEYQFLCLKVSYYRGITKDGPRYKAACEDFDKNSWALLGRVRTEISRAKRLTTPGAYERLNDFYNWLNGVDTELAALVQAEAGRRPRDRSREERAPRYAALPDGNKWGVFHKTLFYGGGREIDEALAGLAADMGLAREGSVTAVEFASKRPERFLMMLEQRLAESKERGPGGADAAAAPRKAAPELPVSSRPTSGVTAEDAAGGADARGRVRSGRG